MNEDLMYIIYVLIAFVAVAIILMGLYVVVCIWSKIEDFVLDDIVRKVRRRTFSSKMIAKEVRRGRMKVMLKVEGRFLKVYLKDDDSIEELDMFKIDELINND